MAYYERRGPCVGLVVVTMTVFISGVVCNSTDLEATTSSPGVSVSATPTARPDTITVANTTSRSAQTCVLDALDRFQEEKIHYYLDVQRFNLLEYRLVFHNNTVNPLKDNMTHVFKVSLIWPSPFGVLLLFSGSS